MSTLNFSNLSSSFKHWGNHSADALPSRNRKIATVDTQPSGRGPDSGRDILTLSHQGQAAYAKHVRKAEKVHQSVQPGSDQPGVIVRTSEPLERVKDVQVYESGNQYQNKDGSTFIIPPEEGGAWQNAEAQEIYERMHSAVAFSEAVDSFMAQVVEELETLRKAAGIDRKEWTQDAVSQIFDYGAHIHIEGTEAGKVTLFARPQDWNAFGKWANDVLQKLQTVREQFVGGIIDNAAPTTQAPSPYLPPNFGSAPQTPPVEENANAVPTLTINSADTLLTRPDGTTTTIWDHFLPVFGTLKGLTIDTQLSANASEACKAYFDFYAEVERELLSMFPSEPGDPRYGLPGTARGITNSLFAQAQIASPMMFALRLEGEDRTFNEEDLAAWTEQFDAFRTQVTQGLEELREIKEIRDKFAFEGDLGRFGTPLNGPLAGNVIQHIILGTNEVKFDTPFGAIMARGQSTDLNWLRQVEQVATKEGLQAAFAREHNYQEVNGAYVPAFTYYDWEKGTQTLVTINIVHSHDNFKTILDDKDKPFTITVTEYSLKDPNDKGKTIAEASGKDYFAWLDSGENFLPHIGDTGFQNWRNDFVDKASGRDTITTWLGSSNSRSAKNSFFQISKLLGLEGTHTTKGSLLDAFNKLIDEEGKELNTLLSGKLKEAGMGDVTKKITFAEDKNGNIVIEGNLSKRQKEQLAKLINDDPELAERIKTQKARQEFARGIEADEIDDKKYNAARTQLLKDVLAKHGTSLDDLDRNRLVLPEDQRDEKYANLYGLLESSPGLHDEIWAYMDRRDEEAKVTQALERLKFQMPGESLKVGADNAEKSTAVRSLLTMKRGELSEAIDNERNFDLELLQLRAGIFKALEHVADEENPIDGYNTTYYKINPDWMITDFDIEFDHNGKMRFSNVQTAGGCEQSIQAATRALHTLFQSDMGGDLGLAILEAHDDMHGDVEEFEHKVVFEGGFGNSYHVESKEADEAAMQELMELTQDIGTALGDFFGKTMGIKNPFEIIFGSDGQLSFDAGSLSSAESQTVRQLLADVNRFLSAEAAGEDSENMLSGKLADIGEKFLALKDVQDKFHDKPLVPKEFRFSLP